MKNTIIIILLLIPFLVIGQNDPNAKVFGEKFSSKEGGFDKQLISKSLNDSERNLETTLINDTRLDKKTILNFDAFTSKNMSLTIIDGNLTKLIDEQILDKMLLDVKPFMDYKSQFRTPIKTKSLFEN